MFVFTKRYFESRLANDLIADSSKIKEIRTWVLLRKLHYQAIVRIWFKELLKSRNEKKLAFMYLAYDVIWHSIKESPEFITEFGLYMEKVFKHLVNVNLDEKAIDKIGEFVKIWRKRQIFDEEIQGAVEKIWKEGSVDEITLVKEIKKEKGFVNQFPPHLTCSACSSLLKEPVQLPCCKTALCKLCAFEKLEQHNACWFGFCPKSVVVRKDDVNLSPELAIQVDLWNAQSKEQFKENGVVTDQEAQMIVNQKSPIKSACTDTTREKIDPADSNILSAVTSGNLLKSHNNPYIVNDSSSDDLAQSNNNGDINTLNGDKNDNVGCLLKWMNPTREEEQCAVAGKNSPMRDAMKRRLQCAEESTKSKMCKQNVNDDDHSCNNHWLCERNSNAGCLLKWIKMTGENEQSAVPVMKKGLRCDKESTQSKMCKQNVNDNREAFNMLRTSDKAIVKEKKHPAVVVKPEPAKMLAPDFGSNGSATTGTFECKVCGFTTTNNVDLDKHLIAGCFRCELCGISTTTNIQLNAHLQGAKHKKKLRVGCFRCELCGINSNSMEDLEKHLQGAKHKMKLDKKEERINLSPLLQL